MSLPGPTIADDTLHYTIYAKEDPSVIVAQIQTWAEGLLPRHIWHKDSFQLATNAKDPFIEGTMRVGDCIDDEWLVVWLLWEISGKWDVAISVYDSDGEFLLIEAAQELPSWVTPSNAKNRVWIYQSNLHLIPLTHTSPSSRRRTTRRSTRQNEDEDFLKPDPENWDEWIDVEDALPVLRDSSYNTIAPPEVIAAIMRRVSKYPRAIPQHLHRTNATIPADVARALQSNPSLVQKAVETFYTRDAMQLRATQKMSRFPPTPNVLASITMTRTAYAQLMGQRFQAPRVFGQRSASIAEGSKEARWWDVGVKLACGFEMLYQESKTRGQSINVNDPTHVDARQEALGRDAAYNKYINGLHSSGYFGSELRGSALWKQLEAKAAHMWVEMRREDDVSRPGFASLVEVALVSAPALLEPSSNDEDPDDWLNIDAKDLEDSLAQYTRKQPENAMDTDTPNHTKPDQPTVDEEAILNEGAERLKSFADKVDAFVEGQGDDKGALFDDDLLSDEESDDTESEDEEDKARERQEAMDKLVPGLEPNEYGRMPEEYTLRNSQKVVPTTLETEMNMPALEGPTADGKASTARPAIRRPIIPRDKYDGVDSDDESSASEGADNDDEEDERPQIVGDIEVDMEAEQAEFLQFTREALGIDEAAWQAILTDRRDRGAFVPTTPGPADEEPATQPKPGTARFFDEIPQAKPSARPPRVPASGSRPNANPELDSFEAVMQAMEDELEKHRPTRQPKSSKGQGKPPETNTTKGKGKAKATANPTPSLAKVEEVASDEDEDEGGVEDAMDSELRRALKKGMGDGDDSEEDEVPMDYNLIKNFLESFKSQAGASGPVGNLAGRLGSGWALPRDN